MSEVCTFGWWTLVQISLKILHMLGLKAPRRKLDSFFQQHYTGSKTHKWSGPAPQTASHNVHNVGPSAPDLKHWCIQLGRVVLWANCLQVFFSGGCCFCLNLRSKFFKWTEKRLSWSRWPRGLRCRPGTETSLSPHFLSVAQLLTL